MNDDDIGAWAFAVLAVGAVLFFGLGVYVGYLVWGTRWT